MSKYLSSEDLQSIENWINKLEKKEAFSIKSEEMTVKELNLPYKLMKSGKHRVVFAIKNDLVLKVPKVGKGVICNKKEVDLYYTVPSKLQKHLCKIVDYGHGWLIMKKMKKNISTKKHKKKTHYLLDKFHKIGIRISDLINKKNGKPKKGNLRINKHNKIVIIDYANNYKC